MIPKLSEMSHRASANTICPETKPGASGGKCTVKQKAQHLEEDHLGEQPTHTAPLPPSTPLPSPGVTPSRDSHGQEAAQELHPKPIEPRPTPHSQRRAVALHLQEIFAQHLCLLSPTGKGGKLEVGDGTACGSEGGGLSPSAPGGAPCPAPVLCCAPLGMGLLCCRDADVHNLPADPGAPACTDAAPLGERGTVTPRHGVMHIHNLRGFLQLW